MGEREEKADFADRVNHYLLQSGYNICQLARLAGIPRTTLASWLAGEVKKPRIWHDIIKMARALRLAEAETNALLRAAGYPPIVRLQAQAQDKGEEELLSSWFTATVTPEKLPPFQVIPRLPTFVGREEALRKIVAWLLVGEYDEPYVLTGAAGIGKTVLAAQLAYQWRARFPDGVLWARLDTSTPHAILQQFGAAYGRDLRIYEDLDSRSAAMREMLAYKKALVVLDNVESSSQLQPLLPPSGACAVLVTTRRRDLVRSDHFLHLDTFTTSESLSLFTRVLGKERVVKEQTLLTDLAAMVGHLPLAVDIIGCRLAHEPGWTTSAFLALLQGEGSQLNNLVFGERSVRAAIAASYALLSPEQQHFFVALGTFGGEDFSVEAASAITDTSLKEAEATLRMLFCLSLVRYGRGKRYRLIPIVRTFAREYLADETVWQRLVDFFGLYVIRYEEDSNALELEQNNILSALATAEERGLPHTIRLNF